MRCNVTVPEGYRTVGEFLVGCVIDGVGHKRFWLAHNELDYKYRSGFVHGELGKVKPWNLSQSRDLQCWHWGCDDVSQLAQVYDSPESLGQGFGHPQE